MIAREEYSLEPLRRERPRLYRAVDDPGYRFAPPRDRVRRKIMANILAGCGEMAGKEPAARIPLCPDSPHPFHQLYITFYMGMEAGALIEQYSFAWRMTGDRRWLERARCWLGAAAGWEHGDRVEEHFYTANRYMQAFAAALDWLAGELTADEERRIESCLAGLLERWWPEVDRTRNSTEGGHHAVVDNGHFGVAALQLLGRDRRAPEWVRAVVDRFRAAVMTNGCGEDGSPCDGLGFWGPENAWMLQFCDALRNVTGLDLYREFPERLRRPLLFLRYHLAPPETIASRRYAPAYADILTADATKQLDGCSPVLMRLAREAGDGHLHALALRDGRMGHLHRYGAGVLGSDAECMVALGPYAFLWHDPAFRASSRAPDLPRSRQFRGRCGESFIMRSGWESRALAVQVSGYAGGAPHEFSNLHLQWSGYPLLTAVGAFESSPVACGNLPCVGGQNEHVALVRDFVPGREGDTVFMESPRTRHGYRLLRGKTPALLVVVRRRPRGVRFLEEDGEFFARLDGHDYLQYPREPFFNDDAGELRMMVRLADAPDHASRRILFHAGTSLPGTAAHKGGTHVSSFFLGFMGDGGGLTFGVRSQDYLLAVVNSAVPEMEAAPGRWHEIAARWGGFNSPGARPFIELEAGGRLRRLDDPDTFGGVGRNAQGILKKERKPFRVRSNTALAFGAPVQLRGAGTKADISFVALDCPGRQPLRVDFEAGPGGETGGGELVYKLNPTDLLEMGRDRALLGAGPERVAVLGLMPGACFRREVVPFFPAGLAASSRRSFRDGAEADATRLLASAGAGDRLALIFFRGQGPPPENFDLEALEAALEG